MMERVKKQPASRSTNPIKSRILPERLSEVTESMESDTAGSFFDLLLEVEFFDFDIYTDKQGHEVTNLQVSVYTY